MMFIFQIQHWNYLYILSLIVSVNYVSHLVDKYNNLIQTMECFVKNFSLPLLRMVSTE